MNTTPTSPSAGVAGVRVTDEMVTRAMEAFAHLPADHNSDTWDREYMRAALTAALGGAAPAKEGMVLVPAAKLEQAEARASALYTTLHTLAQRLGIDYEQAQNAPGKPSDVFMEAARKHFTATPAAPKGGEATELSDWNEFRERRIALFKMWSGFPLEEVEKARDAYVASEQPTTPAGGGAATSTAAYFSFHGG